MPGSGSTVKSAARSDAMKARWADPEYAARERARLAALRAARAAAGQGAPPAPPAGEPPSGGGAPAPAPFTGRRLFGRRRSS